MEKTIYIQLLDEGTKVFRPVPALAIRSNVYEVKGIEVYDPEDETWEFPPGSYVLVEVQKLGGEYVLVAIKEQDPVRDF